MRALKNVLFVQTQQAWLKKEGENIVLKVDKETKGRIPIHKLESLVCFGQVSISPALMAHCTENGVTITFLNQYGRYQARVEGAVSGNVLLRQSQYLASENSDSQSKSLAIAQNMMLGKIHNQRYVINRYIRDYKTQLDTKTLNDLTQVQKQLARSLEKILKVKQLPELLGYEGQASALYFSIFEHLIRQKTFNFKTRNRKPPTDAVNALLSFFYVIMMHDCRSALETVGLDPACGFYHQLRPGRMSLALDMMEEFRPMIDRFVLSLINKKQVTQKDFETQENGAVVLKDKARSNSLKAWHERKQKTIRHEWFEETVPIGLLPWLQAQILARHLRGDCDAYIPFLWK